MAVTEVVETERKYQVDDTARVPDCTTVPAIVRQHTAEPVTLRAVYFDTDSGALAAAGFTLRRREGGSDEGWHLKTPLGESRTEHRVALTAATAAVTATTGESATSTVPSELLDLVLSRTRRDALIEIARVTTERTATTVYTASAATGAEHAAAEIADDRVSATDVRTGILRLWREWEVELLPAGEGDRDDALLETLEPILLSAGASPSDSASKLAQATGRESLTDGATAAGAHLPHDRSTALGATVAILAELRDGLLAADPRARANQPDAVHQMRIMVRRLRGALAAFRGLLDRSVVDEIRDRLSRLGDTLGVVRDAEVRRLRAEALITPGESAPTDIHRRLIEDAAAEYATLLVSLLEYLRSDEYFGLLDDLDALIERPPLTETSLADARSQVRGIVRHETRRARRRLKRINPADIASLHAARKAARRTRYVAEAVSSGDAPVLGKKTRAVADAAEALQDLLGEHRDATLFAERLKEASLQASEAGEDPALYGALIETERAHAREALEKLDDAAQEFARAAKA